MWSKVCAHFWLPARSFPPPLIMPSRSRTEASAARAISSSYVAAAWLTHKELPFKALEAPFFLMQLCILSIFFQEHLKVSAKAIHIKPYMFWILASLELDNLLMFPHESSGDQLERFAAACHSQTAETAWLQPLESPRFHSQPRGAREVPGSPPALWGAQHTGLKGMLVSQSSSSKCTNFSHGIH